MAHYYRNNQRLIPLKKDGTPYSDKWSGYNVKCESLGGVMGATSVLHEYMPTSWGLTQYFINTMMKATMDVSTIIYKQVIAGQSFVLDLDEYEKAAKAKFKELKDEPARIGTEFHNALEHYFKEGIVPESDIYKKACEDAEKLVVKELNIAPQDMLIESTFSCDGYGGTIDVLVPDRFVIDWKSLTKERTPYATECAQLVMYRDGHPKATGNETLINVFFSQSDGRILFTHEWNDEEIIMGTRLYEHALRTKSLYKLMKGIKTWSV